MSNPRMEELWHSEHQDPDPKLIGNVGFGSGSVFNKYGSATLEVDKKDEGMRMRSNTVKSKNSYLNMN